MSRSRRDMAQGDRRWWPCSGVTTTGVLVLEMLLRKRRAIAEAALIGG